MPSHLRRAVVLALSALCLCGTAAAAQNASHSSHVRGRVLDPAGDPVSGAQVTLAGAPPKMTGGNGRFDLGELAPGRYTLDVRRIGFQPASQQIAVLDHDMELVIELKPSAVMLDTVKTDALRQRLPRLFERMDQHLGRVAFGDSLRLRYPNASVADFLKLDKGLAAMIAEPKPTFLLACGKFVYVDGRRVHGSVADASKIPYGAQDVPLRFQPYDTDSLGIQEVVSARDVAAIEVFQSPDFVNESFIPPIRSLDGPEECTRIILIWTKHYKMHPHAG